MDSDHDHDEPFNVSCLSHRKLDRQVRRQVKRVTSAAVMLMQVVSPVLTKRKFSCRDGDTTATTPATTTGLNMPEVGVKMEPTSNPERIVQCVLKQQKIGVLPLGELIKREVSSNTNSCPENRMLSPVSEAVSPNMIHPGIEFCTKGSYRYCSPQNFPLTGVLHPVPDCEQQQGAGMPAGKKMRGKHRVRSVSMSVVCNEHDFGFADADCHTAPLMCLHDDISQGGGCCQDHHQKGVRRNPLRQIGNLFGCFLGGMRRENGEKKSWEKNRGALALLELSRRQQNALAMKQDTIELLQWKLEQLQLLSSAATSLGTNNPVHPIADFPELQCMSKRYTDEEEGKGGQDRIISPQVGEQPYLQSLKLENAEMSAILHIFDMMAIKARLAVRYFCKVFMKQMGVSGYSVWRTLAEIEPDTKFLHKEHTAFILESRLNKALFHSFENDSFDETGLTRIIDPEKRCIIRFRDFQRLKLVDAANAVNNHHKDFDHEFWTFSENKMREMWFLFPWNVVFKDSEERAPFTAAFLDAAKCVWLLHRLAFSVHPHVNILRVGKGMHASSKYVEQVTPIDEGCKTCDGPKVEFMSMPGFQIRKKIIKCQVYRHLQCK